MTYKLIIDVDTGVDDAQALMMALSRPEDVHVLAITCVDGNSSLTQAAKNTLRVLSVCSRLDVPVYAGSTTALAIPKPPRPIVHGSDGLGDRPDVGGPHPSADLVNSEHAVNQMIHLVNIHPGEITLVALGPLTNVALALRLDPQFCTKLKRLVIMGGNINSIGNITSHAEFNFFCDPEAANVVVTQSRICPEIVTWDLCTETAMEWGWYDNVIEKSDTPRGRFHHAITHDYVSTKRTHSPHFFTCDPTAMIIAIKPDAILERQKHYACVELQGSNTRGQMCVERRNTVEQSEPNNVDIILKVDSNILQTYLEGMLKE